MPGFVKNKRDEAIWQKAKSKIKRKKGMSEESYWKMVTEVYKKMGGKTMSKSSSLFINKNTGEVSLIKSKKMPIGTVSKGRKKIKEGVWVPVKKEKLEKKSSEMISTTRDLSEMSDEEIKEIIPAGSYRGVKDGDLTIIRDGTRRIIFEWQNGQPIQIEKETVRSDVKEKKLKLKKDKETKEAEKNGKNIGDFVQLDDGTVIKITKINKEKGTLEGNYYGIRGNVKGKIKTVMLRDVKPYKDTKWIKKK